MFLGKVISPGRLWQASHATGDTDCYAFFPFTFFRSPQVRRFALNQALNATLIAFLPMHYRAGNHHNHWKNPQRQWKITTSANLQHNEDQRALDGEWISALLSEINIYKLLWVIKFSQSRLHCEDVSILQWVQIPPTKTKPLSERVHPHSNHICKGSRKNPNSLSIHSLDNLDFNLLLVQGT